MLLQQQARVEEGRAIYHALTACPSLSRTRHTTTPPAPLDIRPAEGWLVPNAESVFIDPLSIRRTTHDVPPDGGETLRQQQAAIAGAFRGQLAVEEFKGVAEQLGKQRICNVITVGAARTPVTVVNIVHTSYCKVDAEDDMEEEGGEDLAAWPPEDASNANDDAASPILSQRFLWRRLLHLGPQRNDVHTSLKLCYMPPFNASHILFQTGRVLETGANNWVMANIMFEHVTLPILRAAGLRDLQVVQRCRQNIVAMNTMPEGRTLDLPRLHQYNDPLVEYNTRKFAGAIIRLVRHPQGPALGLHKVVMLVFSAGPVVCVGSSTYEQLRAAYELAMPILLEHSILPVVPDPMALATKGPSPPAGRHRKRKRVPTVVLPHKRPRLGVV